MRGQLQLQPCNGHIVLPFSEWIRKLTLSSDATQLHYPLCYRHALRDRSLPPLQSYLTAQWAMEVDDEKHTLNWFAFW